MIFLQLFLTFFIIGLFGFGGGYGMLSLIQAETVVKHHWLSSSEFTNIVAISQMTPGPIGINSATYCGYAAAHNAGFEGMMAVLGSATATFALVLPSFILMVLISRMFMKYMRTPAVQSVFMGLRPAVVGLLAAATLLLCDVENFSSPDINPWQVWREPLPLLRHLYWYDVDEDQPHPHDLLCCLRGPRPALLTSPFIDVLLCRSLALLNSCSLVVQLSLVILLSRVPHVSLEISLHEKAPKLFASIENNLGACYSEDFLLLLHHDLFALCGDRCPV